MEEIIRQKCTAIENNEKCDKPLTFRHAIRGGSVELYICHAGHKRHINQAGRQYTTHKTPGRWKTLQMVQLYRWQRELIASLGHSAQSYIDARLAQDAKTASHVTPGRSR